MNLIKEHPWFKAVNSQGKRMPFLFCFAGANGSGKTTLAKTFLKMNSRNLIFPSNMIDGKKSWGAYAALKPQIVSEYDAERNKTRRVYQLAAARPLQGTFFVDCGSMQSKDAKQELIGRLSNPDYSQYYFSDGMLVIDDFKNICPAKGTPPHNIRTLGINYRHLMLDVIMPVHGLNEMNGDLISNNMKFWLFQTTMKPSETVLERAVNPDELMETADIINRINSRLPQYQGHYFEPYDPTNLEANEWTRANWRPKNF